MNILITGKRNVGKSTLVHTIIKELNLFYCGFITIPYLHYENGKSYKMVDIRTNEFKPISTFDGEKNKGIPEAFSTFGVDCLLRAMQDDSQVVVMDELGRFERLNEDFIDQVNVVLSSSKTVLAVLKAEDIDYLNQIKKRNDCRVFDLDIISFKEAKEHIIKLLNIERGT